MTAEQVWNKWRVELNQMRLELALVARSKQDQYQKTADVVNRMVQLINRLVARCRTDSVLNTEYGPDHFLKWVASGNELLRLLLLEENSRPIIDETLAEINKFVRATK